MKCDFGQKFIIKHHSMDVDKVVIVDREISIDKLETQVDARYRTIDIKVGKYRGRYRKSILFINFCTPVCCGM